MRLFGKSEEKRAQNEAALAEIARLKGLTPAELGALLLPALGKDGVGKGHSTRVQQLCDYLLRDVQPPRKLRALELSGRVSKALDEAERVGFVSTISVTRSPLWQITERGQQALDEDTYRERLDRG